MHSTCALMFDSAKVRIKKETSKSFRTFNTFLTLNQDSSPRTEACMAETYDSNTDRFYNLCNGMCNL